MCQKLLRITAFAYGVFLVFNVFFLFPGQFVAVAGGFFVGFLVVCLFLFLGFFFNYILSHIFIHLFLIGRKGLVGIKGRLPISEFPPL